MTKEQKKELAEAAVVIVAAIALFYLFRRGGAGGNVPLLTPTSTDLSPFGGDTAPAPSVTYNYPGSPYNDPALPPAPSDPAVSFGFGDSNIGGNTLSSGDVLGGINTFGGGGDVGGVSADYGGSTLDGGTGATLPGLPDFNFPGILGPGAGGGGGAGGDSSGCGCCNGPAPSGNAFPTPQAAIDFMQSRMPRVPQIKYQNPYNFSTTDYVTGRTTPANSVVTDTGQVMTLDAYNRLTDSMNAAAQNPGTDETPQPTPGPSFPSFGQLSNSFLSFFQ